MDAPPSSAGASPSRPQRAPLRFPSASLSTGDMASRLLRAAYDGDIPKVKTLAKRLRKAGKSFEEAAGEIKPPYNRCQSPLHMAAWGGRLPMCKYLIKELHFSIDETSKDGMTALKFAIYGNGSTAVARLLLDHGADPNKAASDGSTPLHIAMQRDTYEKAELLLSRGAYVDPMSKYGTPLYMAAKDGNSRMLKLLLQHQADPNVAVPVVHTPLEAASSTRSSECVEPLTEAGDDVNAGTVTPLVAAANAGSADCIKCLLEAGADANIPDDLAGSLLGTGKKIKGTGRLLSEHVHLFILYICPGDNANLSRCTQNGKMPIEIAAIHGWQDCVEALFPVTTPLDRVTDWSIGGIIQHAKHGDSKPQDHLLHGDVGSEFEAQGDDAFWKRDYAQSLTLYTKAVEIDPDDSTLYAKRSLCSLHTGDRGKALDDANACKDMRPNLSKSWYAQGAALILVKEYGRAIEALMSGLNHDFGNKPTY
ncbi:hypothetical protein ACP70R_047172 [Stipagrostis hirtigluma subsp. patula]